MVSPAPASALYTGTVRHARVLPPAHAFGLRVSMLLLDLDEAGALERRIPFLGLSRPRLLEIRPRDHFAGPPSPLRARLNATLQAAGVAPVGGRVLLLSQPRILSHGFNPVSFWWCHDEGGALVAAVAEVHSTFGDRHPYVLPACEAVPTDRGLAWEAKKVMHVSPFFDLEGVYRFELSPPGERLYAGASLLRAGQARIHSAFEARRQPLTRATLGRSLLTHPVMPWTVWTVIHAQALALWRKGARFYRRPRHDPQAASRLPR